MIMNKTSVEGNMPNAELIAIGTELLLGEIQDTNTHSIARMLRGVNIDLFRSTIIGDNVGRIASLFNEALTRSEIVIVTGGLGPTVDDYTREAAAMAFNVELEFHPDLWEKIATRFSSRGILPSENNRRQAYIPANAIVIDNPMGTAPGFMVQKGSRTLVCLPGVPREMEAIMGDTVLPFLVKSYSLQGLIKVRVLHVSGVPESRVDQLVADFETWQNPTVGLLAHPGIVDIRLTAKAESETRADEMITSLERPIRERFGSDIFGVDDETLVDHVRDMITALDRKFILVEAGDKPLMRDLLADSPQILRAEYSTQVLPVESLEDNISSLAANPAHEPVFYFVHWWEDTGIKSVSGIISPGFTRNTKNTYLGPPANGDSWITNTALDFIRRNLPEIKQWKE
ncbi:MAG TPA: competence/damage-inducible protein A [Anaerolineaceae bacterium]|nr:competence/damage-inducible protein A [Anaerolineaceae bacterium]